MAKPRFIPVSDHGVLIEFGDQISDETSDEIHAFDRAFCGSPPAGFLEAIPAYVNILLLFDPLRTDHVRIIEAARATLAKGRTATIKPQTHHINICYDDDLAPDLNVVCQTLDRDKQSVINAHLNGQYRVAMYGFAPGYAYLSGLAPEIQLPRKTTPVRDVPKGSVIIAGAQCIVTTLNMPAGWWRIGRSNAEIFTNQKEAPFLFNVGDLVRFQRIDRATYEQERKAGIS